MNVLRSINSAELTNNAIFAIFFGISILKFTFHIRSMAAKSHTLTVSYLYIIYIYILDQVKDRTSFL